jgi:tRNA G18 (ribose-2'-O)-methylase SpoU
MKMSNTNGYYGIGIYLHKRDHNIGTLWRSAFIMGASFIFTIDKKYKKQSSDVFNSWSRIPLYHHDNFEDFYKNLPHDCRLVGVELTDDAPLLSDYEHPMRAIYLLGSEDNGLPPKVLEKCHEIVKLPGHSSLNVAVTGSIVLHDRVSKVPCDLPNPGDLKKAKCRS